MNKRLSGIIPILIITGVTLLIFWQFFLRGLLPFPGEFMLAWFEPWRTDYSQNGVITLPHKPVSDDIFRQLYPFKILAMDMIKDGKLPLWNPYNGAGQPLLATMHTGILNPLNLLFFLTDNKTAWTLQIILSVLGIGLCTYLFARKIGIKQSGSLFASLSFMLSGFVIVRSIYNDYNFGVLCLPLLLYLIEDYIVNKTKKILFLPVLALFLSTVVQPQIILYVCAFSFLYGIIRVFVGANKITLQNSGILFLLIICGIFLSSIQLLPTFELYKHANITTESSRFIIERFLLPLHHFITILVPNYFGNQATYNYWGAGDYIETIATIGMIPVFLAVIGLLHSKINKSLKVFCITALSLSIVITVKFFLTNMLYSFSVPIISTGIPSRVLFIPAFCIAILAGFGIDTWLEIKKSNKHLVKTLIIYSILIISILLTTGIFSLGKIDCNNAVIKNCWDIAFRNTAFETAAFTVCMVLFVTYLYLQQKHVKTAIKITVFVLLISLGFYNAQKFLPFSPRDHIMPDHALLTQVKKLGAMGRIFGFEKYAIKTDFATQYRFFDANYYDPLYIRRYGELIQFAKTGNLKGLLPRSDVEIPNDQVIASDKSYRRQRLFDLVSVNTLIFPKSDKPWRIERQETKRAFLVNKITVMKENEKILKYLFRENFDPYHEAVVEKDMQLAATGSGIVKITQYNGNTITMRTESDADSLLVLTDNYFPGWKATIDGDQTEVFRTNYTFKGIRLPSGHHDVIFSYEPDSLRFGTYLSGAGLAMLLALSIFWPKISGNKNK